MEDMNERSGDEEENDSEDSPSGELARTDPFFIRYLFTPAPNPNCVFLVGEEPEEIHTENRFLMAHSKVFRLMLQDSALAERGNVRVEDIQPNAFKNLLRFCYGYNVLSHLTMEESVDLMYVAEKYMVEELKPKLSTHISSMLSFENVCIPLQRPECYEQKLLKDAINQKIQDFTDCILQRKDFLDLNMFGLVNILQQDTLAVTEIELWRGVLKWAKHNARSEDVTILRELLTEPLKHIRFCTLALEDFCREVSLTKLLLDHEVLMVINSITNNIVLENLVAVCNTIQTRNSNKCPSTKVNKYFKILLPQLCPMAHNFTKFTIVTNESPITMLDALFECKEHSKLGAVQNIQFLCQCNVTVTHIDYACSTNDDLSNDCVQFSFKREVDYGKEFKIPFLVDGMYMELKKYSEYTFYYKFYNFKYTSIKRFSKCKVSFDENSVKDFQLVSNCCSSISCSLVKQLSYTSRK